MHFVKFLIACNYCKLKCVVYSYPLLGCTDKLYKLCFYKRLTLSIVLIQTKTDKVSMPFEQQWFGCFVVEDLKCRFLVCDWSSSYLEIAMFKGCYNSGIYFQKVTGQFVSICPKSKRVSYSRHIHLIPKWRRIYYSFIFMLISPQCLDSG